MLAVCVTIGPAAGDSFTALDKARLNCPSELAPAVDDFDTAARGADGLPHGPWSSPVADIVRLSKNRSCLRRDVFGIGSYRRLHDKTTGRK